MALRQCILIQAESLPIYLLKYRQVEILDFKALLEVVDTGIVQLNHALASMFHIPLLKSLVVHHSTLKVVTNPLKRIILLNHLYIEDRLRVQAPLHKLIHGK